MEQPDPRNLSLRSKSDTPFIYENVTMEILISQGEIVNR